MLLAVSLSNIYASWQTTYNPAHRCPGLGCLKKLIELHLTARVTIISALIAALMTGSGFQCAASQSSVEKEVAGGQHLPQFFEFPATKVFHGIPAKPVLSTPFARLYRTRIRTAARKGPNFAGSFTIASWGCGSTCIQMALIDERSGEVREGPFPGLDYDGSYRYRDGSSWADGTLEPLSFRSDSRLLVVRGCPGNLEDSNCALFYYEWAGMQFRLIAKHPGIKTVVRGHFEPIKEAASNERPAEMAETRHWNGPESWCGNLRR